MKGEVPDDVAEGHEPHHHAGRTNPPLESQDRGGGGVQRVDVEAALLGDRLDGSPEDRDGRSREQPGGQRRPEQYVGGDRGRRQAEVRPGRAVLGLVRGGVLGREARQRKPVDQPDDNVGIQTGGVEADDDALAGGIAPDVVDARVRPQESLQRFALPFEHGRRIHTKPGSTGHAVDEAGANDGWFAGAHRTGVRHAPCRFDRRVTCPGSRLRIAQPQTPLAAPARAHRVVIRSIPPLPRGSRFHLVNEKARASPDGAFLLHCGSTGPIQDRLPSVQRTQCEFFVKEATRRIGA